MINRDGLIAASPRPTAVGPREASRSPFIFWSPTRIAGNGALQQIIYVEGNYPNDPSSPAGTMFLAYKACQNFQRTFRIPGGTFDGTGNISV